MIADRVGAYVQAYTLYSSTRPFGNSVILGSMDEYNGPQLFMVEPSGLYFVCFKLFNLILLHYFFRGTELQRSEKDAK